MYSYYCGFSLKENTDTCPGCARNVGGIHRENSKQCHHCTNRIPDDSAFCPFCSFSIEPENQPAIDPVPVAEEQVLPPPRKLKANNRIVEESACKSCSEKFSIGEEVVKCDNCGSYYHQNCWMKSGGCSQEQCMVRMKKCPACNGDIKESALKCWHCGHYIDTSVRQPEPVRVEDDLHVGLKILSFCMPLAGAIIYFSYKGSEPKKAQSACTAAVWGFVIGLILRVISVMIK